MKYHVYYFSATGNNAHCCSIIKNALENKGHEVIIRSLNGKTIPIDEVPDRLVMIFPVLGWMPPSFVRKFIRKLPAVKKNTIKAAVFTADGGGGLQALQNTESLLKKRGYDVFLTARAGYCENWLQVMPSPNMERKNKINSDGDRITAVFIDNLLSEKRELYRIPFIHLIWSWAIGHIFLLLGRRFLGKMYIADSDCNSCRLCALCCPTASISMKPGTGKPYWKSNCVSCNRCINICPKQAINTSPARIILLLASIGVFYETGKILYLTYIAPLLESFMSKPILSVINWFSIVLIIVAAHILTLTVFDFLILNPLQRIPFIEKLFSKSFNKTFPRYLMDGYVPQKEELIK